MKVTLTKLQVVIANHVGRYRYNNALRNNKKDAYGLKSKGPGEHQLGARGEEAFCQAFNIHNPWLEGTYKTCADVGRVEIRTRSKTWYELLVRPDDSDDSPFVLVRPVEGEEDTYEIVGWMMGRDAKQEKWLRNHGGRDAAYFPPDEALNPPDTLRKYLA